MLRLKGGENVLVLLQGFGTGIYLRTHLQLRLSGCKVVVLLL